MRKGAGIDRYTRAPIVHGVRCVCPDSTKGREATEDLRRLAEPVGGPAFMETTARSRGTLGGQLNHPLLGNAATSDTWEI